MDKINLKNPDVLFETSWEVCNKVGGIHTVVATKAQTLTREMGDNYITIGPDFNSEEYVEFEEVKTMLPELKAVLREQEGVRIKVGRWKIKGSPISILVDFSSFVAQKDRVLFALWEDYKVDSLGSDWDYIEPVLFGVVAGRVVDYYQRLYCKKESKVIAHFHEWMTASGVLYLDNFNKNVSTLFTTHATVTGRCIAGNGLHLYGDLQNFNADEIAHRFQVMPKHSIEKMGAIYADCFTTVSEITADECKYLLGKEVDVITPNGFEDDFVFGAEEREQKRVASRKAMIDVASAALGKKFESEPLIIGTSGRYEFRNKGLDEFIDSLGLLKYSKDLDRDILAFILVPGWNLGPRHDLQRYVQSGELTLDQYTVANSTHYLGDSDNDSVINKIKANGLYGTCDGRVTVMFVPAYLNMFDGIFNMHYYDMLPGFDATLFPSYYEPWGYTPLESIAFGVPSLTTSLSGFGRWVNLYAKDNRSIAVIPRDDYNDAQVKDEIAEELVKISKYTPEMVQETYNAAIELSKLALWSEQIAFYRQGFDIALTKLAKRVKDIDSAKETNPKYESINILNTFNFSIMKNNPTWTRIMIERSMPEVLKPLEELSLNLWWSWSSDARALFKSIDEAIWNRVDRNPIALIDALSLDKMNALIANEQFMQDLANVYAQFKAYMAAKENRSGETISYFSMEYGLHSSLKIYSGGLGILAGDYLKEASDQNIPLVAVGLLYRYGYFTQKITVHGEQEASYEAQNFYKLPITPMRDAEGHWVTVTLGYPGRDVTARVWRCDVGRIELYLLDTDHDLNQHDDRTITHHLYGGDWENRIKQEIMLGIGGMKALETLNVATDVYHCNEGHAAFISLRRAQHIIETQGMNFREALEIVRSSSLFTTHTPVPAGHDSFPEDMMRQYLSYMPEKLGISWEQFIAIGRENPADHSQRFSMSVLACNCSQEVNGVSWLHGEVSKELLGGMWPGYMKDELYIGYVTNGVHFPTWAAANLRKIYNREFGPSFEDFTYSKDVFQNIYNVSDEELWNARLHLKNKLVNHVINRVKNPQKHRLGSPQEIVKIGESLKPNTLTIGFARRFATYKRAHLLFTDIDRLARIVNNPERPVQFVFAGKAHPNDKPGQDLIKRIVEISSWPQFVGKIIFLQNYDMELARRMVQGVDVWMNTPTRPLEASGTSGEKVVMNGGLHFSVLDGWWVEGYQEGAGWALPLERTFADQSYQDQLDAEMIYTILEEEIAPAYYDKDHRGISQRWMGFIKKSIADVASNFTTKRMIEDYCERFYTKLAKRHSEVVADNCKIARELAAWKKRVGNLWHNNIQIVSSETLSADDCKIIAGTSYNSNVVLDLGELLPTDVGVELLLAEEVGDSHGNQVKIVDTFEFTLASVEGSTATYVMDIDAKNAGSFDVVLRVYAKNDELQSRMDFPLVKWS